MLRVRRNTLFIMLNSLSHKRRRLPVFWGLLNHQRLHDKSNRGYSQDVVSASNCSSTRGTELEAQWQKWRQKISSESINQLIWFISFSPQLKISKKITQRHKIKQHLRIVCYWFEATGPAGSRGSVYAWDYLLGQMIRPSIRFQKNAERKLAVINIWNTSASSNLMWKHTS